jgi:glyoxylase-like metal-dependent hydrolase (beta-lactamase superfamily II)
LIVLGILVAVVAVAGGAIYADAFAGLKPIQDGFQKNGVRWVAEGIGSIAVIPAGPDQVVLIDAGNDAAGAAILAELSRRGLGPEAVAAIFITHGHADHTAAISMFPQAQVMAMEAEAAVVEGRAGTKGPLTRLFPVSPTGVRVTRPLRHEEIVTVGTARVQAFAVPGHTQGSAAYLVNGVLFLGDSANAGSGGQMRQSAWVFSDDLGQARESLARLYRGLLRDGTPVDTLAFAHSGTLSNGKQTLRRFVEAEPF